MALELLDNLVGKPYLAYGVGPEEYDCYGLALEMSSRYGLGYPEQIDYIHTKQHEAIDGQRSQFAKIDSPEFGDLVAIRVGRYVSHLGVMLDSFRFIHSSKPFGVTITRVDSVKYATRIEGFYRCKR
jgi:cell wall-associated NlpC family hydrolase